MNVDCEGLDKEALLSNDWSRFSPEIVSAEIHGLNLESVLTHPIVALMKERGYRMTSYYFATAFFELLAK
jgi:hypothetical protein